MNRGEAARRRRGEFLQKSADALCYARLIGGYSLAAYMFAKRKSSPGTAVAAATIYATDKIDGILARRASSILNRPPTDHGKRLDERVDKQTHKAIAGAQIIEAIRGKHYVFASVVAGNLAVQSWRDHIVNNRRDLAQETSEHSGQAIHVGSTRLSKRKLATQACADIMGCSPLYNTAKGRAVIGLAHTVGTALSLSSGAQIVEELHSATSQALNQNEPMSVPTDSNYNQLKERLNLSRSERLLASLVT